MYLRALCLLALIGLAAAPPVAGQTNGEAARLAEGWARLAKGDPAGAGSSAAAELARNPNSVAALALAVDADLAKGGASAALTTYERWLGSRRLDSAYVLRRIARALLVESTADGTAPGVLLEALKALAADGDSSAAARLEESTVTKGFGETRALASIGNENAIKLLIAQLASMAGAKTAVIEALGESGSELAIPHLMALLADPNDLNRAAAADALARLGAVDAIERIRPLLNDPVFSVRLKAAGALLRLNDSRGLPLLMELTASPHAPIRVAAAKELASQPDAAWQTLVRALANDPDPLVRLEAARLIAPYDQPLANSVLETLMRDDNIALREAAATALVDRVASDFTTLRTMLRSRDAMVRVKAADRILELTR